MSSHIQKCIMLRIIRLPNADYNWSSLCFNLHEVLYYLQSPMASKITFRMLKQAKPLDLYRCLEMELRLGRSILQDSESDFFRGVQAVLIDKTGGVHWKPGSLCDITDETVESHFTAMREFFLQEFTPS